eukprot:TRINITY_DN3813_c0_g1_i1.p1 TRINITY_DN3813_c0_g1~~TRINITY_DN3813_c0_g1_i1.p1  ORF type:complete len:244 (-),score=53.31 TRINITY_DN3813_c0_g1_i1:7-738(-)
MATENERRITDARQYLSSHKIHTLFEQLTAEMIRYKPLHPLDFMIHRVAQMSAGQQEPQRHSVVFVVGGPASGKGTQCARLVEKLGVVAINVTDLLRREARTNSEIGQAVDRAFTRGEEVPNYTIMQLLDAEFKRYPPNSTIVLDGFPQDIKQAMDFEKRLTECRFVLYLEGADDLLERRMQDRLSLEPASEDSAAVRLQVWRVKTHPVLQYYQALGKLQTVPANGSVDEVWKNIEPLFLPMQ